MSILRKLATLVRRPKNQESAGSPGGGAATYSIVPSTDASTDLTIQHVSGVVIRVEADGRVVVSSPSSLTLHAEGDLQITSNTHIGLVAPRIDLN